MAEIDLSPRQTDIISRELEFVASATPHLQAAWRGEKLVFPEEVARELAAELDVCADEYHSEVARVSSKESEDALMRISLAFRDAAHRVRVAVVVP